MRSSTLTVRCSTLTVLAAALLSTFAFAGSASALVVAGDGTITDWGLKPFTLTPDAGSYTSNLPVGVIGLHQSDYSPISYPGIGNYPSGGKAFDLEEMYVKRTGNTYHVLLVDAGGLTADGFNLGDLLIDTNAASDGTGRNWNYGVVTQTSNTNSGLTAGGLYQIGTSGGATVDTTGISTQSGSYGAVQGSPVPGLVGAWALSDSGTIATALSTFAIQTASHDYGTPTTPYAYAYEGPTTLIEYTFTLPSAPAGNTIGLQIAWGCGNDMIGGTFTVPNGAAPEPATLGLGGLGLAGLSLALLRRRR